MTSGLKLGRIFSKPMEYFLCVLVRWFVGCFVGLIADLSFVLQLSFNILLEVLGIGWNVRSALSRPRKSCLDCGLHGESQLNYSYQKISS